MINVLKTLFPCNRVDRVLGFPPVVRIGTPPFLLTRRRVCPLPPWFRGLENTLARGKGGGGFHFGRGANTMVLQI